MFGLADRGDKNKVNSCSVGNVWSYMIAVGEKLHEPMKN